ncbi:MAG: DUF370 domain-containing protein [Eubacteriales bacterium]
MSVKFVQVGFGNYVAAARIVSMVSPESAPIKRLVQDAREAGSVIDASCGRKTKAVIVTDSRHVILSALSTDVLFARLSGEEESADVENEPINEIKE